MYNIFYTLLRINEHNFINLFFDRSWYKLLYIKIIRKQHYKKTSTGNVTHFIKF